jgi:type VI secretion system protein ImpG
MDREFLEHYDRELKLLYEHAKEFAEEYPGIGERLGGLVAERMDPMISGLLEGAAFLAARVQLKLKHEFPEFCNNLIEQLVPHYLAPTPSVMLARVAPPYGDPALREGRTIAKNAYLEATYRELDRQIACRFRLTSDIVIWPFELTAARYFATTSPLQALGLSMGPDVLSGLSLTLMHRGAPKFEDELSDAETSKRPDLWLTGCKTNNLTFHLVGNTADADAVYEQIFANRVGVYFRFLDQFGDPVIVPAPANCISQIGFDDSDSLFPNDTRMFSGFDLVHEYFTFPRKFLGFRLTGLRQIFAKIAARTVDIIITFNDVNMRFMTAAHVDMFALYAAPAINLFEKTVDRIPMKRNQHEHHVVPDRSRYLDYEPHRILEAFAHYRGGRDKVQVLPLYSATKDHLNQPGLCYTLRRLPRKRSTAERRFGVSSSYIGTDMFLTLVEPAGIEDERAVVEMSLKAICSNRHLTEHLHVGQGGADFRFLDLSELVVTCVAGPTPPREPVVSHQRSRGETASTGTVAWRLINMLSLNHSGLVERGAGLNAQALREVLLMFADVTDSATERRIRGVRNVDSKPVVRRMRQDGGVGAARGVEITVTIDEKAFEGSGAFLLGAILERFYSEYASLNHFTQTVIRSQERGEIMRWPVRAGARRLA